MILMSFGGKYYNVDFKNGSLWRNKRKSSAENHWDLEHHKHVKNKTESSVSFLTHPEKIKEILQFDTQFYII